MDNNPFGQVNAPSWLSNLGGGELTGIQIIISIFLRTLIVIAGVYTVINIVLAGLSFISAGGDPKRIQDATAKIWQSLLGFTIAAGAFILAAVIGQILGIDLLQLRYFTS